MAKLRSSLAAVAILHVVSGALNANAAESTFYPQHLRTGHEERWFDLAKQTAVESGEKEYELLRKARIEARTFRAPDIRLAATLHQMGVDCKSANKNEEAYHLLSEASELILKIEKNCPVYSPECLIDFGHLAIDLKRFSKANEIFTEALAASLKRDGVTSLKVAEIKQSLGYVRYQLGKPGEAEQLFRVAAQVLHRNKTLEREEVRCLQNAAIASMLRDIRPDDEAFLSYCIQAHKLVGYGEDPQDLTRLGRYYVKTGNFSKAIRVLENAIEMFKANHSYCGGNYGSSGSGPGDYEVFSTVLSKLFEAEYSQFFYLQDPADLVIAQKLLAEAKSNQAIRQGTSTNH